MAVVSTLYLSDKFINKRIIRIIFNGLILFFVLVNINSILIYYRFYPIYPERLFRPDYFNTENKLSDPIIYLNNIQTAKTDVILDMSNHRLPRFHFLSKTFECNWYWMNINSELKKVLNNDLNYSNLINRFDYIIVDNPIEKSVDTCLPILDFNKDMVHEIYSDNLYLI